MDKSFCFFFQKEVLSYCRCVSLKATWYKLALGFEAVAGQAARVGRVDLSASMGGAMMSAMAAARFSASIRPDGNWPRFTHSQQRAGAGGKAATCKAA
jgi:hypothetical protein